MMSLPNRKKLYREAVEKWGLDLQLVMLMEECAELIQATSKYIRKRNVSAQPARNLAEEIADVEIMIEQLKTVLSYEDLQIQINTNKHDKLRRLQEMLRKNDKQEKE